MDKMIEKIVEYLKTHTREGDCPCAEHQAQVRRMAKEIKKIFVDAGWVKQPKIKYSIGGRR